MLVSVLRLGTGGRSPERKVLICTTALFPLHTYGYDKKTQKNRQS